MATAPSCSSASVARACTSAEEISALLAASISPALATGSESFVVLAVGAWVCIPFVCAIFFRRRPGPRTQARALGIAVAHGLWVVAVLVGVPIARVLELMG